MGARNSAPGGLRDALDALLHDGEPPISVRGDLWASWRRSAVSGLSPDRFAAPHIGEVDHDSLLVRVARPVLEAFIDDLASTGVGLVLTDRGGDILERWVPERSLERHCDRVDLAPGFVYAEPAIGTNGIGTAIAERKPTLVRGSEHFAEALTALACAAAPISDPRTGHVPGILDLTCWAREASALMLPLVRRAAQEIEERLLDDSRFADRVIMKRLLRERSSAKHPILVANGRVVITNTAAERLVRVGDEPVLRDHAERVMAGAAVGAVMHLDDRASRATRPLLGLASLTDTEQAIAELVAQGLTNRQIAERVFVSRHTVDFHLRSIFRKVEVTSRVELAREIVSRATTA
jgi:transcriptional regulator of acetoin/glycerol metabolism